MTIPSSILLMLVVLCAVLIWLGYDVIMLRSLVKKTGHRLDAVTAHCVRTATICAFAMYEIAVLQAVVSATDGCDWCMEDMVTCAYTIGLQTAFIFAVRLVIRFIAVAPALRTSASEHIQAEERPLNGPYADNINGVDDEPDCGDERA